MNTSPSPAATAGDPEGRKGKPQRQQLNAEGLGNNAPDHRPGRSFSTRQYLAELGLGATLTLALRILKSEVFRRVIFIYLYRNNLERHPLRGIAGRKRRVGTGSENSAGRPEMDKPAPMASTYSNRHGRVSCRAGLRPLCSVDAGVLAHLPRFPGLGVHAGYRHACCCGHGRQGVESWR